MIKILSSIYTKLRKDLLIMEFIFSVMVGSVIGISTEEVMEKILNIDGYFIGLISGVLSGWLVYEVI